MIEIKFRFEEEEAARHFLNWFSEQGEANYWEWMGVREDEEEGDITVLQFGYDWDRYLITTLLGRLDDV